MFLTKKNLTKTKKILHLLLAMFIFFGITSCENIDDDISSYEGIEEIQGNESHVSFEKRLNSFMVQPVVTTKPGIIIPPKLIKSKAYSFNAKNSRRYIDKKINGDVKLHLSSSYIDVYSSNEGFLNNSSNNQCGPVAVYNLLKWYGIYKNTSSLVQEMKTNEWFPAPFENIGVKLPGTSTSNLKQTIEKHAPAGYTLVYKHSNPNINEILTPLKKGYPVLVNYRTACNNSHFAVIVGVTFKTNGTDPVLTFANADDMSWTEFKKRWEKRWVFGKIDTSQLFPFAGEFSYTLMYLKENNRPSNWSSDYKETNFPTRKTTFPVEELDTCDPELPGELPIWRMKLRIETADFKSAKTDDSIYVKFKDNKKFYLDTGWNDFDSDDSVKDTTYHIAPALFGVYQLKDIQYMKIGNDGDDGLGIRAITLRINDDEKPIFRKYYGNNESTCQFIDQDKGYPNEIYFSLTQLKSYDGWKIKKHIDSILPPRKIKNWDLLHLIECGLGDQMKHNSDLKGVGWKRKGDKAVALDGGDNKIDRDRIRVDLDFKYKAKFKGISGTATLNFDTDLVLRCRNNQIQFATENVDIDVEDIDPWYIKAIDVIADILTFGLLEAFDVSIDDIIENVANSMQSSLEIQQNIDTPICPDVEFNSDRDLVISYDYYVDRIIDYLKNLD